MINNYLTDDILQALSAQDLDTIVAVMMANQPHLCEIQSLQIRLLRVHLMLDLTGAQDTREHSEVIRYLEELEKAEDRAMVGMMN